MDDFSIKIINRREVFEWLKTAKAKIGNTRDFVRMTAVYYLREIFLTFRKEGAHAGRPRWKPYSINTLHAPMIRKGKVVGRYLRFNIRYGTDLRGQQPPRKRGARVRRYSSRSKLLQASGQFRNSFAVLYSGKDFAHVGTRHRLASKIMKGRPVITPLTQPQRNHLLRLMVNWQRGAFE